MKRKICLTNKWEEEYEGNRELYDFVLEFVSWLFQINYKEGSNGLNSKRIKPSGGLLPSFNKFKLHLRLSETRYLVLPPCRSQSQVRKDSRTGEHVCRSLVRGRNQFKREQGRRRM